MYVAQNHYHIASIRVERGKPAMFWKKKTLTGKKKNRRNLRKSLRGGIPLPGPTDMQQMSHVQLDKITVYKLEYLTEYQEQVIIYHMWNVWIQQDELFNYMSYQRKRISFLPQ